MQAIIVYFCCIKKYNFISKNIIYKILHISKLLFETENFNILFRIYTRDQIIENYLKLGKHDLLLSKKFNIEFIEELKYKQYIKDYVDNKIQKDNLYVSDINYILINCKINFIKKYLDMLISRNNASNWIFGTYKNIDSKKTELIYNISKEEYPKQAKYLLLFHGNIELILKYLGVPKHRDLLFCAKANVLEYFLDKNFMLSDEEFRDCIFYRKKELLKWYFSKIKYIEEYKYGYNKQIIKIFCNINKEHLIPDIYCAYFSEKNIKKFIKKYKPNLICCSKHLKYFNIESSIFKTFEN